MIQQRGNMDWMLKELADDVPDIHQIVVLSADGLRIARHGGDPDVADRLAAACAGLQSLAAAVASKSRTATASCASSSSKSPADSST